MNENMNNEKSAKLFVNSLFTFIIFVIITLIFFITIYARPNTNSITYSEKSNISYNVCLKNNRYFDTNCLEGGKTYVADLINHINIDFSYILNSSELLNQNYSYNITSRVLATSKEDSNKVIYDKTEILEENKNFSDKSKNIANIKKSIKLNYNDYAKIITDFKKDYVLALDSKLIITMNIKYYGTYSDDFDAINKTKSLTIEMPLSEQTVSINKSDDINIDKTIYKNIEDNKIINYILCFFIISDLILLIIVMYAIMKIRPYKEEYLRKLEKILKEYDRAIVTIKKNVDLSEYKVIEVETFEEMVDARDNLEKPILFYKSKRTDKSTFIIINNDEAYVYTLTAKYGGKQ